MNTTQEGTRMTETPDNLPAIRPSAEVAKADVDSWIEAWEPVVKLATHIADTEFVPRGLRGSAPATAAAMLYGREVGLPPMTALNMTHVIEGKPAISAEGMRALVLAAGHDLEVTEASGALVTMRGRRRGSDRWLTLTWNMDMARAAGVAGKNVWRSYPRAMLLARVTTDLCRMLFPDVIHGFRSAEEVDDMNGADVPAEPAAQGTTTVKRTRKSTTARKAVEAPPAQRPADEPDASGPPLPGEDGFEQLDDGKPAASTPAPEPQLPEPSEPDQQTTEAPSEPRTEPEPQDLDNAEHAAQDAERDAERAAEDSSDRRPVTAAQRRMIMALFGKLDLTGDDERDERLYMCGVIIGREVESTSKLNRHEAGQIIDTLGLADGDRVKLNAVLDAVEADRKAEQSSEPVEVDDVS